MSTVCANARHVSTHVVALGPSVCVVSLLQLLPLHCSSTHCCLAANTVAQDAATELIGQKPCLQLVFDVRASPVVVADQPRHARLQSGGHARTQARASALCIGQAYAWLVDKVCCALQAIQCFTSGTCAACWAVYHSCT